MLKGNSSQFRVFAYFLFLKLPNKNAKIDVLEIKILFVPQPWWGGTFRKFPKVKISPLKISGP